MPSLSTRRATAKCTTATDRGVEQAHALRLVVDAAVVAFVEVAAEERHAEDGEDEPEECAEHQNVGDGGQCLVHRAHHLAARQDYRARRPSVPTLRTILICSDRTTTLSGRSARNARATPKLGKIRVTMATSTTKASSLFLSAALSRQQRPRREAGRLGWRAGEVTRCCESRQSCDSTRPWQPTSAASPL